MNQNQYPPQSAKSPQTENRFAIVIGLAAIVFGLLTLKEGGSVLFFDGESRAAAGNYIPFVLIFNFIAGFFYVLAGFGLLKRKQWAHQLAFGIASATAIVFVALGIHILLGGAYETRTIGAMIFRLTFWVVLSMASKRLVKI